MTNHTSGQSGLSLDAPTPRQNPKEEYTSSQRQPEAPERKGAGHAPATPTDTGTPAPQRLCTATVTNGVLATAKADFGGSLKSRGVISGYFRALPAPFSISRETRLRTLEAHPALLTHVGHRNLFVLVASGAFLGESGRTVIPAYQVARCYGADAEYQIGHRATWPLLESFRRDVCPEFDYTGWHSAGIAREVRRSGINEEVLRGWKADLSTNPRLLQDPVSFHTGRRVNPSRAREREKAEAAQLQAPCEDSRAWCALLNDAPSRLFAERITRSMDEAWAYALSLDGARGHMARLNLHAINDSPQPTYLPCEHSVRLRTVGLSLQTAPKAVRRVLLKGCQELDLKSSQLAIVAAIWGIDALYNYLAAGGSIWADLERHVAAGPVKEALKRALYGAVYGAGIPRMTRDMKTTALDRCGVRLTTGHVERFLTHPMIQELLGAREARMREIGDKGGAYDCFGRWLSVDAMKRSTGRNTRHAIRSILAQLSQATELLLLRPVLEMALEERRKERAAFSVVLFQHDGFSVHIRRSPDTVLKRIMGAVAYHCKTLGFPTCLEVTGA